MAARAVWAAFVACAQLLPRGSAHQLRSAAISSEGHFVYDYEHHGLDWTQGSCASRQRQSPINFDDLASPATGKLSYEYQPVKESVEVANNGHALTADVAGRGYGGITFEGNWYNLMNINVHARSEHTFKTLHKPVELHLVHKKVDSDMLLIVAIPLDSTNPPPAFVQESVLTRNTTRKVSLSTRAAKAAEAPSPAPETDAFAMAHVYQPPVPSEVYFQPTVQMFLKVAPPQVDHKAVNPINEVEPVDLNLLFQGGTFFEYAGSLTAPPCSEIATWFVRREPVFASDRQVHFLHDAVYHTTGMRGNNRETMPLNHRAIAVRQAVKEEKPAPEPEMSIPLGPNPRTDREFRALKWSKDALKLAKQSTDYIRDLDFRLRSAAQAHANALAPNLVPEVMPTPPPMEVKDEGPTPAEMAKTAQMMANTIAGAAKAAIADASKQIAVDAKAAAVAAAKEAAKMVKDGLPPTGEIAASPGAAEVAAAAFF